MKRIRSSRRFGLPLALLLGATAAWTTLAPTPALAWEQALVFDSTDGHVTIWRQDDGNGHDKYAVQIDKGDKSLISFSHAVLVYVLEKDTGDPGPDDDTRRQSEPVDVAGLIKKGLITYKIKVTPENTKLSTWIEQGGGGFAPHWNPGDDNNKGPTTPARKNDGPTAKQLAGLAKLVNAAAAELKQIGLSMGDVGDVGSESAPGLPTNKSVYGSKKGGGNDPDNKNTLGNGSDNQKNKRKILGSDLSLGPRPDLVNPPLSNSGRTKTNLFAPGLLETGGGLSSSNGPSTVGTPLGGVGSRGNIR